MNQKIRNQKRKMRKYRHATREVVKWLWYSHIMEYNSTGKKNKVNSVTNWNDLQLVVKKTKQKTMCRIIYIVSYHLYFKNAGGITCLLIYA